MPIGLSVCPCVCNTPLIGSYYIYCLLLFNTTIPDPLGLSVCKLLERTEVLCAQLRYVDKAFVHTKTWWSAQRLRGVDSHFVHGLCGTLRDCSFLQNVSWDGPHEAFAHCLCAPRPTFAQSLCAPPEVFVVHVGALVDANHVCISSCISMHIKTFTVFCPIALERGTNFSEKVKKRALGPLFPYLRRRYEKPL